MKRGKLASIVIRTFGVTPGVCLQKVVRAKKYDPIESLSVIIEPCVRANHLHARPCMYGSTVLCVDEFPAPHVAA